MTEIKLCAWCKHFRSIGKLSWRKNACGCEKKKWKLTVKLFNKERWNKKMDMAKDCSLFRRKKDGSKKQN